MKEKQFDTKSLVLTALFTAIGLVLPQAFHFIPNAGSIILPMHSPVLLCGLTVGGLYGAACGAVTVLLSSLITGMPPLFPIGVCMMFELAAYGFFSGIAYRLLRCRKNPKMLYAALAVGMLSGRIVNGLVSSVVMGMAGKPYGVQAFLMGAFVTALPGIIIQFVIIPPLVLALQKFHLTAREEN